MVYRVMGIMSGSSLDGLDIAFIELEELSGRWSFHILQAECAPYSDEWSNKLRNAVHLSARDYLLLHTEYGHYIGMQVKEFMAKHALDFQVSLIASHGHTTFHMPPLMTGQIGDGAAIAAETGLPVVSDLRAVDVALGGQGAPIVPIGEKLLWPSTSMFLNIGGIANISINGSDNYLAYDICPANRVLNMLALLNGKEFDDNGQMAATGQVNERLLAQLNALPFYAQSYPKSLANDFGTDVVYPLVLASGLSVEDMLCTYTEHIAVQVAHEVENHLQQVNEIAPQILVTGGGALNNFLIDRLQYHLGAMHVKVDRPDEQIIQYKEALIMGMLGVLRWREETTALSSVTGATRDSVGGALWISQ
ncbi:MAG: anhydro-N-acetylmuramic acid kinase [Sphingobacteriales bacterium]|jgi:anhydro-N-acetylmuramic acid kinase